MIELTVQQWKDRVTEEWPEAEFTQEDGSGKTYGDIGEWTAHVGPDMQMDTVGIYSIEFCNVETADSVAAISDHIEYGVTGGLNLNK